MLSPWNVDHVTNSFLLTFNFRVSDPPKRNPFEVLSNMSKAKFVQLDCFDYEAFDLVPFVNESLTSLRMNCFESSPAWTFDEFKAVFTFFPNLTFLFLELQALTGDFDELVGWKSLFCIDIVRRSPSAQTIYYLILTRLSNETFTWSEMLVRKQK